MFTDTHCHIYKEYYEDIDEIVNKIKNSGINRVINNGCDDKSNKEVLSLLPKYPSFMYGALGIHPESVDEYTESDMKYVENHINDKDIVAVGEIGLDYHWTKENIDKQKALFDRQLSLAEAVNKPVIIHSRDATVDTIEILKKHHVKGVMHAFSGSYETAMIYIKMGLLIGVGGVITFKNCNLKDVIDKLDLSNIVLETDSPYLTPTPYRGERNDPSHVMDVAKYICDLKGIRLEELSKITNENIKRCFDI